jgi:hypothetical protein
MFVSRNCDPLYSTFLGILQVFVLFIYRKCCLLFMLLPLVRGQITIEIEATDSASISKVELFGSIRDVISDKEQISFGITEKPLLDGAERYSGGRPQDVFVRSPTPWNDLYLSYGWPQVKRTLRPVRSTITGIKTEPVIVATKEFINNSTYTALFNAGILQEVQNTVTNSWERGHELTVGYSLMYEVKMGFGSVSSGGGVSYTSAWGKTTTESQTLRVGSTSALEVTLEPGQAVVASMTATRGTMNVLVDYEATLDGIVACNYPRKYNGHHFWAYNVRAVMGALNLPTTLRSKETLRIGFYSTARLILSDLVTKKKLLSIPVSITPVDY